MLQCTVYSVQSIKTHIYSVHGTVRIVNVEHTVSNVECWVKPSRPDSSHRSARRRGGWTTAGTEDTVNLLTLPHTVQCSAVHCACSAVQWTKSSAAPFTVLNTEEPHFFSHDRYKARCTAAHWTLNTAHWTLNIAIQHSIQNPKKVWSTTCTAQCTLNTAQCTLHTAHWIVFSEYCTLHTAHGHPTWLLHVNPSAVKQSVTTALCTLSAAWCNKVWCCLVHYIRVQWCSVTYSEEQCYSHRPYGVKQTISP